jgi:dnd system-associated protein 4
MRAVRRNKIHEPIVKALLEKMPGLEKGVYSTIRDVMVLAASLGYEHRKRVRLGREPISLDSDPFEAHSRTRGFMLTLALAETQDQDLLKAEETPGVVVDIFEEYACGGFGILAEWLKDAPDDANHALTIIDRLSRMGVLKTNVANPPSDDVDF